MTIAYKPAGYTSVARCLAVSGASDCLRFLGTVFGAALMRQYGDERGNATLAELRIDDTVVMPSESMEGWPAVAGHVHVYVEDAPATCHLAIGAGAAPAGQPVRKNDEDKRGGVRDAGGITWWVGTRVA